MSKFKTIKSFFYQEATLIPNVTWVLLATNLLFFTARFMIMPFMAIYFREKLNIGASEVGVLLGVSPLASMLFSVVGGRMADKYGPATVFPFSLFVPALCYLAYPVSPYFLIFVLAAIAGMGWSIFNSTIKTLLTEYSSEESLSKVFNYNYWGVNLGGVIGPLIGAYLLSSGHSSFPIILFSVILIAISAFMFFFLKNYKGFQASEKQKEKFFDKKRFQALLKDKVLMILTACFFFSFFIESQQNSNIAQYLDQTLVDGTVIFAHMLSLGTLIIVIVQPIYAQISDKISLKVTFLIGSLFYVIGPLFYALPSSQWKWYVGVICMVLGEVIIAPNLSALVAKSSSEGLRTTYFSIINMGGNFAFAIGPWIGGMVLGFLGGTSLFLMLILFAFLQAAALFAVIRASAEKNMSEERQDVST